MTEEWEWSPDGGEMIGTVTVDRKAQRAYVRYHNPKVGIPYTLTLQAWEQWVAGVMHAKLTGKGTITTSVEVRRKDG